MFGSGTSGVVQSVRVNEPGVRGIAMEGSANDRAEQAAGTQSLFREINERVRALNESFSQLLDLGDWICECANETCVEPIELSSKAYEEIRQNGARFFVAPSDEHVWPDVERVIERRPRYWVIEKIGKAGELARQADPRGQDDPLSLTS
jgi:hypothetical protein